LKAVNEAQADRWEKKLLTHLKNMLPGSDLAKIRELNEKIRSAAGLLNFTLSSALQKKRTNSSENSNSRIIRY
jgi:hypothetical protein